MFSAISTSTTITITPVSAVAPAAPVAPVTPSPAPAPAPLPDATTATLSAAADEVLTASGNDDKAKAAQTPAPAPAAERHALARIPVTLDAQLMQAENRLADCVNCPSAKTPAGQAQIDAVSSQIRHIRQRMFDRDGTDAYSAVPMPIGLNLDACA